MLVTCCVRLFEDAIVGYPFLCVGTEDGSECVLLELFERFDNHISPGPLDRITC